MQDRIVLTAPPVPLSHLARSSQRRGVTKSSICPSPSEERTPGRGVGVRCICVFKLQLDYFGNP